MKAPASSLTTLTVLASATDAFVFAPSRLHTESAIRVATRLRAETIRPPVSSNFLTPELAKSCIEAASGTPLYAYSLDALASSADACLAFPNAYGLTVRYAMKACPNGSILKYFL